MVRCDELTDHAWSVIESLLPAALLIGGQWRDHWTGIDSSMESARQPHSALVGRTAEAVLTGR